MKLYNVSALCNFVSRKIFNRPQWRNCQDFIMTKSFCSKGPPFWVFRNSWFSKKMIEKQTKFQTDSTFLRCAGFGLFLACWPSSSSFFLYFSRIFHFRYKDCLSLLNQTTLAHYKQEKGSIIVVRGARGCGKSAFLAYLSKKRSDLRKTLFCAGVKVCIFPLDPSSQIGSWTR